MTIVKASIHMMREVLGESQRSYKVVLMASKGPTELVMRLVCLTSARCSSRFVTFGAIGTDMAHKVQGVLCRAACFVFKKIDLITAQRG